MPKVLNKTLGCRDGRKGSSMQEYSICHYDRLPRRNNNNSYDDSVSFKESKTRSARDNPWKRIQTYTPNNTRTRINSNNNNNNNQAILTGRNTDTESESDRKVKEPSPEDELPDSTYYKIIIPNGHKHSKDYLINKLINYVAPETLVPIKYRANGNGASFFVDDRKVAVALIDYEVTAYGQKDRIRITIPPFPRCIIDDEFEERVKVAVEKRYVAATKSIVLSRFHRDYELISDYFCALFCPPVLDFVFNVISEQMPDLRALILDGNILDIDLTLRMVKLKLSKLKILHIGNNSIKNIQEINAIKNLELEELKLAGNPMCNEYQSRKEYIKDVRKLCPELLRLDDMDLSELKCVAVGEGNNMAVPKRMFLTKAQAEQIVKEFLEQYFLIFDTDNREKLLTAYANDACFSMILFDPHNPHNSHNPNNFNEYITDDRNVSRIDDTDDTKKLLIQGRWPIVKFLYKMSQTYHYWYDLTFGNRSITEGTMSVTLAGMFEEIDKEEQPIRYFERTLTIIFKGSECCIKNEELHITEPTEAQLKELSQLQVETDDLEA